MRKQIIKEFYFSFILKRTFWLDRLELIIKKQLKNTNSKIILFSGWKLYTIAKCFECKIFLKHAICPQRNTTRMSNFSNFILFDQLSGTKPSNRSKEFTYTTCRWPKQKFNGKVLFFGFILNVPQNHKNFFL